MKSKKMYVLLLLVLVSYQLMAQDNADIKIGDLCPDVTLKSIVNYEKDAVKISDFRGSLLILDFWATWCSPCVSAFGTLDSIEKKFGNKIRVLPVTKESKEVVKMFLEKMNEVKHISPASVTDDTILNELFKHTYIPHYVWIDKNGIVKAITGLEQVTTGNIEAVLNEGAASIPEKKDVTRQFDIEKPAFIIANTFKFEGVEHLDTLSTTSLLYQSIISKSIDGVPGYATVDDSTRITVINHPISSLYAIAAGHFAWEFFMPNRLLVNIRDSTLYFNCTSKHKATNEFISGDEWLEWARNNAFCYELKVPQTLVNRKYDIMLKDLNNYFGELYGIVGGMEKKKTKVLALRRTTTEDKIKTKGVNKPYKQNAYFYGLYNEPFGYLVSDLRKQYQISYPLVDETGYKGKVDIELTCDLSNKDELNKALAKYGLKLIEEEKLIDMVVIKDKRP